MIGPYYQVIVETVAQPREFVLDEYTDRDSAEAEVRRLLADLPHGVTNAYAHRRHY